MTMKHILGWALAGSVAWAGTALAQQSLAIIELQHRSAQDVLPVLVPLVEPGGSLSGFDYKLFLRASPANREEIRRALSALDTPPRRLRIEVSQNRSSADSQSGWAGSGQIVIRPPRGASCSSRRICSSRGRTSTSPPPPRTGSGGRRSPAV